MSFSSFVLPFLNIIEPISYEENKQKLISLIEAISPDIVLAESTEEMVQLEAFATELTYRDAKVNDRLRSVLPIFAKGANLDIACADYYGTTRLENESDEAFLERSQLSLEQSVTTGAYIPYIFHTRSVDARIVQVAPYRAEDGNITVVWHTLEEDDAELTLLQTAIEEKLNKEELRTLCATSQSVVLATKKTLNVSANLTLDSGLDREEMKNLAESTLREYVSNMKISEELYLSKINSLLHVNGVKKVNIAEPLFDVIVSKTEIATLSDVTLTTNEVQDA